MNTPQSSSAQKFLVVEKIELGWGTTPGGDRVVFIRPAAVWEGKPFPALGIPYHSAKQFISQMQQVLDNMDQTPATGGN